MFKLTSVTACLNLQRKKKFLRDYTRRDDGRQA
jgi:hypothetical protein